MQLISPAHPEAQVLQSTMSSWAGSVTAVVPSKRNQRQGPVWSAREGGQGTGAGKGKALAVYECCQNGSHYPEPSALYEPISPLPREDHNIRPAPPLTLSLCLPCPSLSSCPSLHPAPPSTLAPPSFLLLPPPRPAPSALPRSIHPAPPFALPLLRLLTIPCPVAPQCPHSMSQHVQVPQLAEPHAIACCTVFAF